MARVPADARIVADFDPEYPDALRALRDRPRVLVIRGGAIPPASQAVAIVGSRAATPYGLTQASRVSGDLARLGITVVSGLARGIDAAAHRGALEAGGATIAVLPGALDHVTPSSHRVLAESITGQGALISEFPDPVPITRRSFVHRNRLIAALAGATLVVEAAEGSGALHTATVARRLGRVVLAMPGDVDRPTARGTHDLLRAGASLCTCANDVLEALAGRSDGARSSTPRARSRKPAGAKTSPSAAPAAGAEALLLAALSREPRTAEQLATAAGLPLGTALAALLALEWSGSARAVAGPRWVRGGASRA